MDFRLLKGVHKENYSLKHLTWLKVGGAADFFFKPDSLDDLTIFLQENNNKMPVTVIGAGSNIIIRDKGIRGAVIKLSRNFTNIELVNDNLVAVGAGCLNFNLARFCQANSITGFEFLVGIPGTVGGGVSMNAGAYGSEFKDIVAFVESVDKYGNIKTFSAEEIGFLYRGNSLPEDLNLIFTKVVFNVKDRGDSVKIAQKMREITNIRNSSQPFTEKTGGSTFSNPAGFKAWELIEKSALRGKKIGGACMSEKHCNFMVNYNNATASDMENLGELVKKTVKKDSNIELKWEIKRIGIL